MTTEERPQQVQPAPFAPSGKTAEALLDELRKRLQPNPHDHFTSWDAPSRDRQLSWGEFHTGLKGLGYQSGDARTLSAIK